jgi:hypothetical protein
MEVGFNSGSLRLKPMFSLAFPEDLYFKWNASARYGRHTCNSSYKGGISRRVEVAGQPRQNHKTLPEK